jgi:hypothetical protein
MYRNTLLNRALIGTTLSLAAAITGCSSRGSVALADSTRTAPNDAEQRVSIPPAERIHLATLPAGTLLRVRTTSTVSTRSNRAGETFRASLEDPLVTNGLVVAPRGSDVTVEITDSNKGGRIKGRAHIALSLLSINSTGLHHIRTNTLWYQARGTKKKDFAKIGAGTGIGAGIGAIAGGGIGAAVGAGAGAGAGGILVLSTRGDPAVVPSESVLQFRLREPLTVEIRS